MGLCPFGPGLARSWEAIGPTGRAEAFFDQQQPAAFLKHAILQQYLPVFVNKTGMRSRGHRVFFLDGYAGPGVYKSGARGSPALAAETARTLARQRDLQLIFVEQDPTLYDQLCSLLQDGATNWVAYPGRLEDNLDYVLEEAAGYSFFAFFDPFGLCIPFDDLVGKVLGRGSRPGAATEVLLNVSLSGIRRRCGSAASADSGKGGYVDYRLGPWWREVWEAGDPDRPDRIAREYVRRLSAAAGGWSTWLVPVPDSWSGPPAYYLALFTKHPHGRWFFHDALSRAREQFYEFCHPAGGQGAMFDLSFEGANRESWTRTIERNVDEELDLRGSFQLRDRMPQVYGDALGWARSKHVLEALKRLYEADRILHPPRSKDLPDYWVVSPNPKARKVF